MLTPLGLLQNVITLQPLFLFLERGLSSSLFARRYWGNKQLFSFPPLTEMFHFSGFTRSHFHGRASRILRDRLPHSDTSGSKVARHLPEDYRSHATSFVASSNQGIHHMLLYFLLGNLKTLIQCSVFSTARKNRLFLPAHLILNISFSSCCRPEIAVPNKQKAAFLKRLRNSRKKGITFSALRN